MRRAACLLLTEVTWKYHWLTTQFRTRMSGFSTLTTSQQGLTSFLRTHRHNSLRFHSVALQLPAGSFDMRMSTMIASQLSALLTASSTTLVSTAIPARNSRPSVSDIHSPRGHGN